MCNTRAMPIAYKDMFQAGGGGDCSCEHAEEDLTRDHSSVM